jgi:hypothetical protein
LRGSFLGDIMNECLIRILGHQLRAAKKRFARERSRAG